MTGVRPPHGGASCCDSVVGDLHWYPGVPDLLHHLVRELLQLQGDIDAERRSRLKIDQQFELRRLLDRKVSRLCIFENLVGIDR
jgi:hypothetical protein